jgi:peptidoglycan/LPS O-acetylase OafA/YrhL
MGAAARSSRVPELDCLRFVAALAVLLFHYTSWDSLDTYLRLGWIGVPLFFMISGFVILWSATGSTPSRFVAARVSRLYPSFWVCATLAALIKLDHVTLTQYVANMTFAHFVLKIDSINSVFWTLFVEIKFYVIVFALLSLGQLKHVEKWALAWLVASFIPALDTITLGDFGALFLAGMFMFLIWRDGPSPLRLAATLVAAVAGTLQMSTEPVLANYSVSGQFVPAVLVLTGCHVALFAIAMRWFRIHTSFYLLGSLTYPLYLIHGPLGDRIWALLDAPPVAKLIVASIVSLLVSAVIAACVERRACGALNRLLNRWLDRFAASRQPIRIPSAPGGEAWPALAAQPPGRWGVSRSPGFDGRSRVPACGDDRRVGKSDNPLII